MEEIQNELSFDARKASYLTERIGLTLAALVIGWSLLVAYSYHWNEANLRNEKIALATSEARSLWNKDQAFRQWATRHGGVYVKPDERTPPSPYLAHMPLRDVETTAGMRLTLMNPAYMMRQMTQEFERSYGIKGKITGLKYLNPVNAPDDWERRILDRYQAGDTGEVIEETSIGGEPYLRYMKPMFMVPGCDTCHAVLGYKTGELRGGVSVSVPLAPYFSAAKQSSASMLATHLGVWLLGDFGLAVFGVSAVRKRRDRMQLLAQLEQRALYDQLTGLPTRALFDDRVKQAIRAYRRSPDSLFAVCFVDLDRFKQINDAYGHSVGDKLLHAVAGVLTRVIRLSDSVARLGGDEYIVLVNGIDSVDGALRIAERINRELQAPFEVLGHQVKIGASVGVALIDDHYMTPDEMIRDADIAMYRAKHHGRGGVEVFNARMHDAVRELVELEADLRQALQNREFELFYQPVVNLRDNCIAGFEALLRWRHPERGFVPPDRFIPVAEDIGIIAAIGEWVFDQACRQLHTWRMRCGSAQRVMTMSVNLSARQLVSPAILDTVQEAIRRHDLRPDQLCLEVTETALIREQDQARQHLDGLSRFGCRLSADDFGTGYSSLTYLQQYRFDSYKIDKQFVQDTGDQGAGMKLCKALIGLAEDLNMVVIAEGVETYEQCLRLQDMGCEWMQGYYFSRPLPAAEIEKLFEQGLHHDLDRLAKRAAA
ncbi:MAG: EAL domain-containing protein [Sedimenticolaceae bacterium]